METLIAQQQDSPPVDPAAIDAQLKRLAVVVYSDEDYHRKRDALRAQRAHAATGPGGVAKMMEMV